MPSTQEAFATSGYRAIQWSVVGIARTQQRRSSSGSLSKNAATANTSLTVTLLYMPTETLYAWPFNLSSPDAKGVCYETCCPGENGATQTPPEGTMSTSLRVLADVIRYWMSIRRERSALTQHRGSTGSLSNGPDSPGTQLDKVLDDDEVINEIIDALRLYQLTPFERSIYLMRQKLPEPSSQDSTALDQQACASVSSSHRGRQQSNSSVCSTESGCDSDRDSRYRSDSSASSQASNIDWSPDRSLKAKPAASPKLPKINTAVGPAELKDTKTAVPQIRLLEATPQDWCYEERDHVLEKSLASVPRNCSFGGRSMDTVQEDVSEDVEADGGGAAWSGDGEIRLIKIQASHRSKEDDGAASPKTAPLPDSFFGAPQRTKSVRFNDAQPSSSSPTGVVFLDPFKGVACSSSMPEIRVETIEYGRPGVAVDQDQDTQASIAGWSAFHLWSSKVTVKR